MRVVKNKDGKTFCVRSGERREGGDALMLRSMPRRMTEKTAVAAITKRPIGVEGVASPYPTEVMTINMLRPHEHVREGICKRQGE